MAPSGTAPSVLHSSLLHGSPLHGSLPRCTVLRCKAPSQLHGFLRVAELPHCTAPSLLYSTLTTAQFPIAWVLHGSPLHGSPMHGCCMAPSPLHGSLPVAQLPVARLPCAELLQEGPLPHTREGSACPVPTCCPADVPGSHHHPATAAFILLFRTRHLSPASPGPHRLRVLTSTPPRGGAGVTRVGCHHPCRGPGAGGDSLRGVGTEL